MNYNLIEVHRNELWVASDLVARKFGMKHKELVKIVNSVLNDYPDLRGVSNPPKTIEKYYIENRHYRGSDYDAYIMNRFFFSLVAIRMASKIAFFVPASKSNFFVPLVLILVHLAHLRPLSVFMDLPLVERICAYYCAYYFVQPLLAIRFHGITHPVS